MPTAQIISMAQRIPSQGRKKLLWTMYAFLTRMLDKIESRYGSIEAAIAKEKETKAIVVSLPIRNNKSRAGGHENRGGMVDWIAENYPKAASAHRFIIEARDTLEKAGCLNHRSHGAGHVGSTEIHMESALAMIYVLENCLGVKHRYPEAASIRHLSNEEGC